MVHPPAVAFHSALFPRTAIVHVRFPCTVTVASDPVVIPSTTSMSVTVAVALSVDDGETVKLSSAGFVIVAGLLIETVGEHLPEAPATLHVVWARATTGASAMREVRIARLIVQTPDEHGTSPTPRFPCSRPRSSCPSANRHAPILCDVA